MSVKALGEEFIGLDFFNCIPAGLAGKVNIKSEYYGIHKFSYGLGSTFKSYWSGQIMQALVRWQ